MKNKGITEYFGEIEITKEYNWITSKKVDKK